MNRIALVIPCYKCLPHIFSVLEQVPKEVEKIYVVDDFCPMQTGRQVEERVHDKRVKVLTHSQNRGVGGAVITGYQEALRDGYDIIIKLDGDGQMNPMDIHKFVYPLVQKKADYVKGNRFYFPHHLSGMPWLRVFGNSVLSFISKLSTGYWHMMDPTNGFTAIHRKALGILELDQIDQRFFFETDMLWHLNLSGAVVLDVPLQSTYGEENSNLKVQKILVPFLAKHIFRTFKRFFYSYIIRDFNLGSIEAIFGGLFLGFGTLFGGYYWWKSISTGHLASSGTVMLAGISIILGIQMIIGATLYDISRIPRVPLQEILDDETAPEGRFSHRFNNQ